MGFHYNAPASMSELLSGIKNADNCYFLAGGTDLVVKIKEGLIAPEFVVDLGKIKELREIADAGLVIIIGATVTHSQLQKSPLIKKYAAVLASAAGQVGSPQIRNVGTVGGNICNASPVADTSPALLVLDGVVEVKGVNGNRNIPLKDFFVRPAVTVLEKGEFVTSIYIKKVQPGEGASFQKIGKRKALAISVTNAAVWLKKDGDKIADIRIALGAVAAKTIRIPAVEDQLKGLVFDQSVASKAGELAKASVKPITDLRSTADYRADVVDVIVEQAMCEAWAQAKGGN